MDITAKDFEIKMTQSELWNTAFDVKHHLEYTIKTHWVHHQDNWRKHEEERLYRLKYMFYSLGRPDIHDDLFSFAKEEFEKFNALKTK